VPRVRHLVLLRPRLNFRIADLLKEHPNLRRAAGN
jgi:hypothetical protein